ncbi:MAG TPA: radical SAM protein [Steroidobacteraceae bacterium]|nr:radical SAM protein [Steroidobacteraceae bacterium]
MLSILVAHSYFLRLDPKQSERAKPYPPLATLQVAAMLRRSGHEVSLFDAMLSENLADYQRQLALTRPRLLLLYEDNFNFLSKMCLDRMRTAACEMIALARRSGARVIASGPDATDAPEAYLRAGADLVLLGEGLSTLAAVLQRLDSGQAAAAPVLADGLCGIAWQLDDGVCVVNRARPAPIAQPDEQPAWDLIDIEAYRRAWIEAHGYFSLNMAASRGCSFRCNWCAKPIWGNQYLQRHPERVAKEMAYLKRSFRPDHIWFADDIFGFRVDWIQEFTRVLEAEDGAVPFTIQTRADLLSERMALALRAAGCREAWIGAESGSQRVLDAMNKGTKVSEIAAARARLKAAGIRVGFFIQLGYLGEDLPDILATRELLETTLPDDVGVSVSYPLPGTRFYELVRAQLGHKTHWSDSGDLAMMFRGTYTSEFYRAIRNLLHERISLEALNAPAHAARYRRGRHRLDQRWQALLSSEHEHRTCASRATA